MDFIIGFRLVLWGTWRVACCYGRCCGLFFWLTFAAGWGWLIVGCYWATGFAGYTYPFLFWSFT
jgi:hypothetical protein